MGFTSLFGVSAGAKSLPFCKAASDAIATCEIRWFNGSEIFLNRLSSQGTQRRDVVDLTEDDEPGHSKREGELSLDELVAGQGLRSVLVASYGMNRDDVVAVFGQPETLTLVDQYDHVREAPGVEPLVGEGAFAGWTLVRPMFEQGPAYKGWLLLGVTVSMSKAWQRHRYTQCFV